MPYLTPDSVPESADCRTLFIPASSDWLAIVSGALTELVKSYNWQQFGAVTVEEAVAVCQGILDQYYEGCQGCVLPGNTPLFRLNRLGEIEQLVDGEWVPPQGGYALPPTPPRTEPTAEERRCLAAANAAAVLEQLYEEISDAFQEGMTFQQWTEFLTGLLITLLGTIFGLVVAPLVVIGVLIVGVIYEVLEFITADVWNEEVTEMVRCMLYDCAVDTAGGVIHFDFPCFLDKLASATDIFDPTFSQIRLFGQIAYIMQVLGAQSLDAMGATTGVETADCDDCGGSWCRLYDFTIDERGWEAQDGTQAVYTAGVGWQTVGLDTALTYYRYAAIVGFIAAEIEYIEMGFTLTQGDCYDTGDVNAISSQGFANVFWTNPICSDPSSPAVWCYGDLPEPLPVTTTQILVQMFAGASALHVDPGGQVTITYVKLMGRGTPPSGGEVCDYEDCYTP